MHRDWYRKKGPLQKVGGKITRKDTFSIHQQISYLNGQFLGVRRKQKCVMGISVACLVSREVRESSILDVSVRTRASLLM